jgi:mediator of RNA polymerase II transcription subunit 13
MSGGDPAEQPLPLEPPMISVGKASAIMQVLPPALRFWEKLGLRPRGGKKDVVAFVFFEEDQERQQQVENWLERMSATYSVSN